MLAEILLAPKILPLVPDVCIMAPVILPLALTAPVNMLPLVILPLVDIELEPKEDKKLAALALEYPAAKPDNSAPFPKI